MKQGFRAALRFSYIQTAFAAALAGLFVCAAPQVGYGVIKAPLAASHTRVPVALPVHLSEAAPPVEVVLSHADLHLWAAVGQAPLTLPISFGRPVAPEDDTSPPPPRWHHRRVAHSARAHHTVTPRPAAADITELAPTDFGVATAQGDDESTP